METHYSLSKVLQWPSPYIIWYGAETRRVGYTTRWGETREISVFATKIIIFHSFSPKNHCFALFPLDLNRDPDGDDPPLSKFQVAASPCDGNGVAFGAFMHDMKYIIVLQPYYSLHSLYRYTRKCKGPARWPTIKGAYIGAYPAPCKDSIPICRLGMITLMVSKEMKIILIFAMLVTMPYSFIGIAEFFFSDLRLWCIQKANFLFSVFLRLK